MNCGKAIKRTTSAPPQILEITGFWTLDGRVSTGSLETILEKNSQDVPILRRVNKWLSERMKYNIYASFPFQQTVIPKWKLECHNLTGSFRQEQYWKLLKITTPKQKVAGIRMKSGILVSAKNLEMTGFERALDIRNPNSCFEKVTTFKQKATGKTNFKIQVNIIGGKTTKKVISETTCILHQTDFGKNIISHNHRATFQDNIWKRSQFIAEIPPAFAKKRKKLKSIGIRKLDAKFGKLLHF